MKNLLIKNTLRCAAATKGRFISIMAIIMIGCAFFSGVKASCPYMKRSAWDYFNSQNLSDIRIKSTLGFDDDDVAALAGYETTEDICAGYSAELFMKTDGEDLIFSVYSYDPASALDKVIIEEGRIPVNDSECLVDYSMYKGREFAVGDKITLTGEHDGDISDILKIQEFTVCGIVRSPLYISFERGAASVGNGTVNGYLYIPRESFAYEAYTDIFLTAEGLSEIDPYSDAYEERVDFLKELYEQKGMERLSARCDDIRADADEELENARAEIADAQKEYDKALKKYNDGVKKLRDAKAELGVQKKEYEKGVSAYETGRADLTAADKNIETALSGCSYAETCILTYADSYLPSLPQGMRDKLKEMQDSVTALGIDIPLKDQLAIYVITPPDEEGEKQTAAAELNTAVASIRVACSSVENTLGEKEILLDESAEQLEDAKKQLEKAEKLIIKNQEKLDSAKEELDSAGEKIADAEAEIADRENELDERLGSAEWYVFGRSDINPYYSHYSEDADRVDAIAKVFPIFFIAVAGLVCVCTMTRMAEEQRTETGTLRALGFDSGAMTAQFVGYAAAASIIGSAIGVPLGLYTIPKVIFNAYGTMYAFPSLSTPMRWDYFFGCMGASLLCTGLSSFIAQRSVSAENPASLMRPRPPVSGKRIFLEKLTFIWKNLKFSHKVTFRNLFRYKIRLFMTVTGIAGCTALLLTGFGLKYAISSIVDRQFEEIFLYDMLAVTDDEMSESSAQSLDELIGSSENISEKMKVSQTAADVYCGDKMTEQCYIFAPEEDSSAESFISLRERESQMPLRISDSGVIINEKLASLLGVGTGGSIRIDGASADVPVTGITENYTMNYVYMSQRTYEELFGKFSPNEILINMKENADPDALAKDLLAKDGVIGVSLSSEGGDKFRRLVESLDLIVLVLIVFSGALAMVILFNLASINLTERIRELATIKVLGFFDGEVTAYILRENMISTFIGIVPGLVLGILLESFVVRTAEVDVVMFARDIAPYCYGYAAAITFGFAMFVNFVMHFRMKRIDMAASLKAAE